MRDIVYRRFGYCTNTMTKLVIVADFNSGENDMKEVKESLSVCHANIGRYFSNFMHAM